MIFSVIKSVVFACVFFVSGTYSSSNGDANSAEVLVSRARQLQALWVDGTPRLRMRAGLQVFAANGAVAHGQYLVDWVSPFRWGGDSLWKLFACPSAQWRGLLAEERVELTFFRGSGVGDSVLSDLEARLMKDRNSINKYEIVRTVLERLNSKGEPALRERREILDEYASAKPLDSESASCHVAICSRKANPQILYTRNASSTSSNTA